MAALYESGTDTRNNTDTWVFGPPDSSTNACSYSYAPPEEEADPGPTLEELQAESAANSRRGWWMLPVPAAGGLPIPLAWGRPTTRPGARSDIPSGTPTGHRRRE